MALLLIQGGAVYDPANEVDGIVKDIWIRGGKIVAGPASPEERPDKILDARGMVVMPGGVDMHAHIAGPKVNVARKMRWPRRTETARRARSPDRRCNFSLGATVGSASRALSPPATFMPAWGTPPPSMPPFLPWGRGMPTKSLTIRRPSIRGSSFSSATTIM